MKLIGKQYKHNSRMQTDVGAIIVEVGLKNEIKIM